MANRTMLNTRLKLSAPTLINREWEMEKNARKQNRNLGLQAESNAEQILTAGSKIEGAQIYTIKKKIETPSGEADIYLCSTSDLKQVAAKIYKRENPLKKGIINTIKSINSPYVASVYDVFSWRDRTVVILPYYQQGSLAGKKFTLDELRDFVIPNINEGLKALHDKNMIHKDLKPANIMLNDDQKSVSIIDFGISSILEEGNTVLLTKTGMTPVYSAPELFNGLALVEADYYSFGITLYELYCGSTPYTGLSDTEIAKFTSIQRIPLPSDMPAELKKLISGLTYPDITNRHKKSNPNRRWTYQEVNAWLRGEELLAPGGFDAAEIKAFPFQGKQYTKIQDLIEEMGLNWDAGKKIVFHGTLATHVKPTNLDLYAICNEAVQQASTLAGKDDMVFFRFLYQASPQLKAIYWKGRKFESLSALGRTMLDTLWNHDESQYKVYDSILGENVLSTYISVRAAENESLLQTVKKLEALWASIKEEKKDLRYVYYLTAYLLSNQIILKIENEEIRTVNELADYLNNKLKVSVRTLIEATHQFVNYNGELDVQMEAWLSALGKQNEIDRWRELLQDGGDPV